MDKQHLIIEAAQRYARAHANADGLASTPIPGLRMMCVDRPRGNLQSVYHPLVCLILQGEKRLMVGRQEQHCIAGQSIIVGADMPVAGQVIDASPTKPYVAVAVGLDMALLRELIDRNDGPASADRTPTQTLFLQNSDDVILDCVMRLMRLIDRPDAVPVLLPGLMKELHFWLFEGHNGQQLQMLAASESLPTRLGFSIAVLRRDFRGRISAEKLAKAASMGLTAFHKHFKELTSLTPGQYQKRLRLIEARRLMLYESHNASNAAYAVGYESVPQFTRDYRRLFGAPPTRSIRSEIYICDSPSQAH